MTDTGQIPGEGLPEHGVGDAARPPHAGLPGNGTPQQAEWGTDPYAAPQPYAAEQGQGGPGFAYLEQPAPPGSVLDDEDDVLLMPGPQGAWSDPQPVPPQPGTAGPMGTGMPAGAAASAFAQHPMADVIAVEVPTEVPVERLAPQAAAPARRPLHMGPPVQDTPSGGVSVRPLAERGPAVSVQGPLTSGPEYLDVPRDETIPAQQNGDSGAWAVQAAVQHAGQQPGQAPAQPDVSRQSLIPQTDSVIPAQAAPPAVSEGLGFPSPAAPASPVSPAEGPQFAPPGDAVADTGAGSAAGSAVPDAAASAEVSGAPGGTGDVGATAPASAPAEAAVGVSVGAPVQGFAVPGQAAADPGAGSPAVAGANGSHGLLAGDAVPVGMVTVAAGHAPAVAVAAGVNGSGANGAAVNGSGVNGFGDGPSMPAGQAAVGTSAVAAPGHDGSVPVAAAAVESTGVPVGADGLVTADAVAGAAGMPTGSGARPVASTGKHGAGPGAAGRRNHGTRRRAHAGTAAKHGVVTPAGTQAGPGQDAGLGGMPSAVAAPVADEVNAAGAPVDGSGDATLPQGAADAGALSAPGAADAPQGVAEPVAANAAAVPGSSVPQVPAQQGPAEGAQVPPAADSAVVGAPVEVPSPVAGQPGTVDPNAPVAGQVPGGAATAVADPQAGAAAQADVPAGVVPPQAAAAPAAVQANAAAAQGGSDADQPQPQIPAGDSAPQGVADATPAGGTDTAQAAQPAVVTDAAVGPNAPGADGSSAPHAVTPQAGAEANAVPAAAGDNAAAGSGMSVVNSVPAQPAPPQPAAASADSVAAQGAGEAYAAQASESSAIEAAPAAVQPHPADAAAPAEPAAPAAAQPGAVAQAATPGTGTPHEGADQTDAQASTTAVAAQPVPQAASMPPAAAAAPQNGDAKSTGQPGGSDTNAVPVAPVQPQPANAPGGPGTDGAADVPQAEPVPQGAGDAQATAETSGAPAAQAAADAITPPGAGAVEAQPGIVFADEPASGEAAADAPAAAPVLPPAQGPAAEPYEPAVRDAVHRVIRERRDIRNGFRSDPIPHDVLLRVLEAAHTAPSVGHSQPWDFVVIRSEATREKMHALAMQQRDAYAKSLPKARARQFRELKIEAILETPVNIVVTADPTRGGRHTLGRHTQPQMAPYSSALAVENLWLAARAEGLGVGWVSFFDERQMVTELGLPEHLEVVAYLCIGYVDEFPEEPELMQAGWSKRRPLSWVVHEEEYGNRALPGEDPHDLLDETLRGIRPLDAKALGEAWERQKRMTKPAGALGMLEIISAQLSGLSRQCPPPVPEPAAVAIFAGDHGVHAQGVTAWPQEVTGQMVANFLGGGAVCNAFANQVGAEVCVVDVGVASELPSTPGLLPRKVRAGTADFTTGPAMTREEALRAIEVGIETARDLTAAGNKALLTGEMGIANTTTSAVLIAVFTEVDAAEVTGRGTGINDEMHARKVEVVRRALELHQPDPADPVGVLAAVGGLEHAAMVGLLLGAAALRTPVILDGVSAGAAALVARAIAPEVLAACIAGHRSAEPGHLAALTTLGLRPLVDLDLRLGEGTGALLALPLVQSAARVMHEVATFDAAGVTEKG